MTTKLKSTLLIGALLISGCTGSSVDSTTNLSSGTSGARSELALGEQSGNLIVVNTLSPPDNTRDGLDQLIAENDILEIDVFQVDQLDKTVQVGSNGKFSMPLIGSVVAAGKTIPSIENDLEQRYGANYLQSPDITVFVKESAGQRMTLDGQFLKPGIYPTASTTTLLQAVALGGGLTSLSDEKKIFVYRSFGDIKKVANYNIKDIREGKITDPKIYGGDVVVAFASGTKLAAKNLREALGAAVNVARVASPL